MKGKAKCKILREIRQKIAEENDIALVTKDCTYQGDCKGTCPKCEAELAYLEQELEKRKRLGKRVTVAALAATVAMGAVGCVPDVKGDVPASGYESTEAATTENQTDTDELMLIGEVAMPEETTDTDSTLEVAGLFLPPEPTQPEDITELEGDVAYFCETTETAEDEG